MLYFRRDKEENNEKSGKEGRERRKKENNAFEREEKMTSREGGMKKSLEWRYKN